MSESSVKIIVYRWAGSWGPFKVKVPCGECALSKDVILDTIEHELAGLNIELEMHDWLSHWWKPLLLGGWHAPIVVVAGKIISQGSALNRGVLSQAVIEAHANQSKMEGNKIFGKQSCPHCKRAKQYLNEANIEYDYLDVVKSPRALYEMLARVKPLIGAKTPVTVPQIWIDGHYVGGADQLESIVKVHVEPNYNRGQCSLSTGVDPHPK